MPSENDYHLRATVAKSSLGAQLQFFYVALESLGSSGKKFFENNLVTCVQAMYSIFHGQRDKVVCSFLKCTLIR